MQITAVALSAALMFSGGGGDAPREVPRQETQVPVLFFHHIDENVTGDTVITPRKFDEISLFLENEGYVTIGFDDLVAYVDEGEPLPENPVILTFDDGYRSNLTYAAPILRARGQEATVFVIGVSMGKDMYKDTDIPIIPHFSWAEAKEWRDVIALGSHTYDMHQSPETDGPDFREGVLPKPDEIPGLHYSLFLSDIYRSIQDMKAAWGQPPLAFAYPYGKYSPETEAVLKELGIRVSLTVSPGRNPVVRGDPESLYHLHRFEVFETTSLAEIKHYLLTSDYRSPFTPAPVEEAPQETQEEQVS